MATEQQILELKCGCANKRQFCYTKESREADNRGTEGGNKF